MKNYLLLLLLLIAPFLLKAQKTITLSKDTISYDATNFEQQAQFPGGYDKLQQYLRANLKRPTIPVPGKGRVILAFIVEKDGSLTDIRVIRGLGKPFDDEALRVMKNSPKWRPASQNNIIMRVNYTLPISFLN
jgi:protein TonB